jgi:hypothetical protein
LAFPFRAVGLIIEPPKRGGYRMRLLKVFGLGVACVVWVMAAGNSGQGQENPYYLFLETWTQWKVEVLEGSFNLVIDFPTYFYDPDQQILEVMFVEDPRLATDRSFLALWGDGINLIVLNGIGGGSSSRLTGIYQVPFSSEGGSFELLRMESDGMVEVRFRGELLLLRPRESWQTLAPPQVRRWWNGALIRESFTYTVTNWGLWPKEKLVFHFPGGGL